MGKTHPILNLPVLTHEYCRGTALEEVFWEMVIFAGNSITTRPPTQTNQSCLKRVTPLRISLTVFFQVTVLWWQEIIFQFPLSCLTLSCASQSCSSPSRGCLPGILLRGYIFGLVFARLNMSQTLGTVSPFALIISIILHLGLSASSRVCMFRVVHKVSAQVKEKSAMVYFLALSVNYLTGKSPNHSGFPHGYIIFLGLIFAPWLPSILLYSPAFYSLSEKNHFSAFCN